MNDYDAIFAEITGGKKAATNKYDAAMPRIPSERMTGSVTLPDYTEGMTEPQKFLAGIGKRMTDRVLGAKQIFGLANAQDAKEKAALDASLVKDGGAGSLGSMATDMVAPLLFPASSVRGAAALGAGMGMTEPSKGGGRGEGYPNLMANKLGVSTLDAALYSGTQAVFNRLIHGASPNTPEQKAAIEFAKNELKTPMTAGQMTAEPATKGVSFAQRLERQASGMPTTKGYFDNILERQNADVKDFVEKKLLNTDYNTWGAGKNVAFDPQFRGDVGAIRGNFDMMPGVPASVPELEKQASMLMKRGSLPAIGPKDEFNSAQGLRRMYAAKSNPTGGQTTVPEDKAAYQSFVKALDDTIERSVPGYKDVRGTYQIEQALKPAKVTNLNGQEYFDITRVGAEIRKMDKKNPTILNNLGDRGEQLRNLANFAEHAKMANTSGTAENSLAQKLMLNPYLGQAVLGGAGGGIGAGASYAQGNDPLQGGLMGAGIGALAGPILINTILQTGIKGIAPNAAKAMAEKYPWMAEALARARLSPTAGLLGQLNQE